MPLYFIETNKSLISILWAHLMADCDREQFPKADRRMTKPLSDGIVEGFLYNCPIPVLGQAIPQ